MSLSPSQLISVMSGLPPERERERERKREGGVRGREGWRCEYNFFGPSLHPLLEQRDRDVITQMHRLSRAFADHVLPAHKSGSTHVELMLGPASSAR